jgi:small subunit ribosomal protein S18
MPRGDRERRRGAKDVARRGKKKVCIFCKDRIEWVDYKDVNLLRRFMSERGKIRARRVSGNCAQHQREVAVAIKTARELALLPYTQRTVADRGRRLPREEPLPPALAVSAAGGIEPDGEELEAADVDEAELEDTELAEVGADLMAEADEALHTGGDG